MMENVYCPLQGKEIEYGECFETCMVAERMAPERLLPKAIKGNPKFRETCLNCKNHRE